MRTKQRKVVDSNYLQTDDLRAFLSASADNFAVMTEWAAMEAYKNNPAKSLPLSMSVLADFPKQVIVLKGAEQIAALTSPVSNPQIRLIDKDQTVGFATFCRHLKLADSRPDIRAEIETLGKAADANMAKMIEQAKVLASAIPDMLSIYSEEEKRALRTGADVLPVSKLGAQLLQLTALMLKQAGVKQAPSFDALLDTFLFRQTMCVYIWILRTMGGPVPSNPSKIRNDVIDAVYAAYATFFDGLLSKDKLVNEIYDVAITWLANLKA